ncbi:hypothetical protein VPHD239_0106 [Vibrio phage D239]
MKTFNITENGTFDLPFTDYDRASLYLVGSLGGGAVVEFLIFGSVIHTVDPSNPIILSMGKGAPVQVRITGATTFTDTKIAAYEVR